MFSFRIDGRLHGVRIRQNFKTQDGAAAEKAALELNALQTTSGLQSATTFLTADQLREAEAAFCRLQSRLAAAARVIIYYTDFGLLFCPDRSE